MVAPEQGGIRVRAASREARAAGASAGQLLTDARAVCPGLTVTELAPDVDRDDLDRLARYLVRFSPWVTPDPPDSILLESSGCDHLFGGEEAMLAEMQTCLQRLELSPRLAVAGSIGAAWALARYGRETSVILPPGGERRALAPLPLPALRLDSEALRRLGQVGFRTIGQIMDKPRIPLAARYGEGLRRRLEQALCLQPEPLSPLSPVPDYRTHLSFLEPLLLEDQIKEVLERLLEQILLLLKRDGMGARQFDFRLFRVDGEVQSLAVRTGRAGLEQPHLMRLFAERMALLWDEANVGFGYDHMMLCAFAVEPEAAYQTGLDNSAAAHDPAALQRLLDRFENRFGRDSLRLFRPRDSHIPERSQRLVPLSEAGEADWPAHLDKLFGRTSLARPPLLLERPEEVNAMAEVPDGPPVRFTWRRVAHRVTRAEGPERIAPEWWAQEAAELRLTRDYFRLEDEAGQRFWMFRAGLTERGEEVRWYMHGLFP